MRLRRSLQDIRHLVRPVPYPKQLPTELGPLHCYLADGGHCILAIPRPLLGEALKKDPLMYEVPLPARFVLETGYAPVPGTDCVTVDVPYDEIFGAQVPEGYEEF